MAGCTHKTSPPTLDTYARQYAQLTAALGERDPDSLDFYIGPKAAATNPPKLAEIQQQVTTLRDDLRQIQSTDPQRSSTLIAQLDAIILRTQILAGHNQPFDQESRTLFGVVATPDHDTITRAHTRTEIARLLGPNNNSAHAYTTYDARFTVPSAKVPAVFQAALRECRTETLKHITLPANEHVDVEYVSTKPWSGFSRYLGNAHSLIQINMDYPHTIDRLLDLACHEGYPGHHVFNTLRDQSLVQSRHREEWSVQPTFSPQSFVSEAAASYAPELAFPFEQRLHIERDILFPIAGLNPRDAERYLRIQQFIASLSTAQPAIARDYLDDNLEFVRAAAALEHETLMEHAETMLLYLNEYRTYTLAYTLGHDRLRTLVERDNAPIVTCWQRYQQLMTQPITSLN